MDIDFSEFEALNMLASDINVKILNSSIHANFSRLLAINFHFYNSIDRFHYCNEIYMCVCGRPSPKLISLGMRVIRLTFK